MIGDTSNVHAVSEERISLIVCTRSRAGSLERLLDSLFDAGHRAGDQIVFVDNGSTDATPEVLARFQVPDLQVDVVDEPVAGLSRARNAGLGVADGEIVAFTDDDCVVDREFFPALRRVFADSRVAFCTGQVLLADPEDDEYGTKPGDDYVVFEPGRFLPTGAVVGCCMAYRASVIADVGTFDEYIGAGTRWRFEDVDYAQRASSRGYRGVRDPSLRVWHAHGRRPGRNIELVIEADDIARGAYHVKHALARGPRRAHASALMSAVRQLPKPTSKRELSGAASYLLLGSRSWRTTLRPR